MQASFALNVLSYCLQQNPCNDTTCVNLLTPSILLPSSFAPPAFTPPLSCRLLSIFGRRPSPSSARLNEGPRSPSRRERAEYSRPSPTPAAPSSARSAVRSSGAGGLGLGEAGIQLRFCCIMLYHVSNTPWDCHRSADQARGGASKICLGRRPTWQSQTRRVWMWYPNSPDIAASGRSRSVAIDRGRSGGTRSGWASLARFL